MIQRRSEFKSCSVLNMACVSRPVLKPSLKAYSDNACLRSDSEHNEHPPHITSKSCVMRGVSKVSKAKLKTTKTPYRLWTSPSTRHAILSVIILYILFLVIPATIEGCYVFPTGKKDPCEDEQCHFLAVCVASSDGKEARCQCIDECNDYGTSQGNTEICGDDGNDYKNWCELKKAACNSMTEIKIKYYGRCGKYMYIRLFHSLLRQIGACVIHSMCLFPLYRYSTNEMSFANSLGIDNFQGASKSKLWKVLFKCQTAKIRVRCGVTWCYI